MVISLFQPYSFCQLGQRSNQEDSRLPDADVPLGKQLFFIVCDGVGGCDDGEVASRSVCEGLADALCDTDWSEPFTTDDFQYALTAAYNRLDSVAEKKGNRDMATTLAFVCFHGNGCLAAHIGDSRIYQIRPKTGIIYRSSDHSQVNSMIHAGVVSPDKATLHANRSVISRYMEPSSDDTTRCMASVLQIDDIQADDYFFLCTDGVLESIDDEMLCRIISIQDSDEVKCRQIATFCQQSKDNNTAYLLHVADVTGKDDVFVLESGRSDGGTYTERQTLPIRKSPAQVVDVEADDPETSLADDIFNFIKNIFH